MTCPQKLLAVVLAVAVAGTVRAVPQTPAAPAQQVPSLQEQDPRARIRVTTSLVVVPVTVKGDGGELVTDLRQGEFRVFEDGIEQQISLFSTDAFPLSVAVLVDNDLKQSFAERVQKTLEALAGGISASDEVSLWRFDQFPEPVADFIGDNDALITQLKRMELNSSFPGFGSAATTSPQPRVNTQAPTGAPPTSGSTFGHPNYKHITDAIYAAADQLRGRARDRRKIVFLISDGQNAKNNTHTYEETLKLLLASDVSVYAVGVGEATLNRGVNVLAKFAHSTGGDIFYGSSQERLEELYARVCEQARNQYTLGYVPAHTDTTRPYHAIEVRARRPGLSLLTRDGYYPGGKL
jgi:VWFA-related protein